RRSRRKRQRVRVTIAGSLAFTTDVGAGGFCAELMKVHPPGTKVRGTITFAGRDFDYVGLVRWTKSGNARLRLTGHMGVRFLQVPPPFIDLLEQKLAEH